MCRSPYALVQVLLVCVALAVPASAQFKEVGPAPYSQPVARQKIRALIEKTDPSDPKATVNALFALAPWYRDLLDEELIAAWKKDTRFMLTGILGPLADARLASAIVEYSWRQQPEAAFTLDYAPMLGQLMERYPDSATPFLADLLAPASSGRPSLAGEQAAAVCRILIDMPDTANWKKATAQILPRYRPIAIRLLNQDLHGSDTEKSYRAQSLLRDLGADQPSIAGQQPTGRRKLAPPPATPPDPPPADPAPAVTGRASNGRPTLARADVPPAAPTNAPALASPPPPAAPPSLHSHDTSGKLQCSGGPVPQNAEYVFKNLPPGNLQLDYDARIWEARLVPGEGQTQKLVLRNISSGPQKRCTVHWSVNP